MKSTLVLFTAVGCIWIWSTTIYAQSPYQYVRGAEIPLDDFPDMVWGFRIQVGAFSTQEAAGRLRALLQDQLAQSVHLHYEKGIWQVRVGDFQDSSSAREYLQEILNPLGYGKAWVVMDKISAPLSSQPVLEKMGGFRLQVKALQDKERALNLARSLDYRFSDIRAYVVWQDSLYKVQLGDFKSRQQAVCWQDSLVVIPDIEPWIVTTQVYLQPPPTPFKYPRVDSFEYDNN